MRGISISIIIYLTIVGKRKVGIFKKKKNIEQRRRKRLYVLIVAMTS